jgi:EmrB/QacA subfamily drug resistance transporter
MRIHATPWALVSLSLSTVLASFGTSSATVALPTLAGAFAAPVPAVQWVIVAYLLATTTVIVSVGRLGDILGRRRLLLAGLALFASASVACAVAPSLGLLIGARAVQGVGAAVMLALSLALVSETVPAARTGSAMGLLGATSAIGTAFGPTLGGVLIAGFGWRAVFLVNVPLAIAAFVLARHALPPDRPRTDGGRPAFDWAGMVLLALVLAAYALAMTSGRGRFGSLHAVLLATALLGAGLFVLVETRAATPLVPLTLLRDSQLRAGLAMSALVSTVIMATLVVGPFYLFRTLGLNAAMVGLVSSCGPLVVAVTGIPAGRLVDRFGAARMTRVGLSCAVPGALMLSLLPAASGIAGYVTAIVVITAGYGLFQTANNAAVMSGVRPDRRGVVSGLLNLSRNLGLITGASAMGAVFAFASGTIDLATARPEAVASGMRVTFGVATVLLLGGLALAVGTEGRDRARAGNGE